MKVEKKIGSRKNQEMEQTETDGILTSKKYTFFHGGQHSEPEWKT